MIFRRPGPPADGFRLRMAAFYAAMFAFAGIQMPFLPVWLGAKGLDSREIGLVLATAMVARPLVVPLATRIVDRFGWAKGPLVAAACAACAAFIAVALSDGFLAIIVTYAMSGLPQAVMLPLADAYALRGLAGRKNDYGPVRLWGSVTFIVANLAGGLVLERLGAASVIWVLVAALALTALAATLLVPLESHRAEAAAPAGEGTSLWRSPAFVAVVAAASLIQASHAVYYGFASLQWAAGGLDGVSIGVLWGIGVVAEIALFAASGRFLTRLRPLDLLGLGAAGAVLRWAAMAFDPPSGLVPLLQCLHALSFGATHLGTMHFLARFTAGRQGATAQGDYAAVAATLFAGATGLAGVLVAAFASHAYLAMAAAAAVAGAIVVVARRGGMA